MSLFPVKCMLASCRRYKLEHVCRRSDTFGVTPFDTRFTLNIDPLHSVLHTFSQYESMLGQNKA